MGTPVPNMRGGFFERGRPECGPKCGRRWIAPGAGPPQIAHIKQIACIKKGAPWGALRDWLRLDPLIRAPSDREGCSTFQLLDGLRL